MAVSDGHFFYQRSSPAFRSGSSPALTIVDRLGFGALRAAEKHAAHADEGLGIAGKAALIAAHVRSDDRLAGDTGPPAALYHYSPDRKGEQRFCWFGTKPHIMYGM